MTSLTRWKVASALFAAIAGYALFLRGPADDVAAESISSGRDGSISALYKRPLRVSAESIGISKQDLIDQLLTAKSVKDVQQLAEKLGIVGDDASISSGLSPEELVVVDGTEKLREGSRVEVRNQGDKPANDTDASPTGVDIHQPGRRS